METKSKAIVLLSGGQDSTTCLFWAQNKFDVVRAVGFDYGQTHKQEVEQALKICQNAGVIYNLINVQNLLGKSSLTENGDHNESSDIDSALPASFTPGRNLLFLTIASSKYVGEGFRDFVTGVCQTDFSGYPDCRRQTIDAQQLTLTLGLGAGDIRIHTPLMYKTKAETFKMAKELGVLDVIINDTLTDYNGDMTLHEWGRGTNDNPATNLRVKGYYEAKDKGWI